MSLSRSLPWLIGLTGYARSGKDTVAGLLAELGDYERVAYADPLKSMALAIDPWVDVDIEEMKGHHQRLSMVVGLFGWDVAKQQEEVRRLLQRLGTEGVRHHLGDTAWIDALGRRLAVTTPGWVTSPERRYVVTDVRFPNEADAIRRWGGIVWRVARDGAGAGENAGHASETSVDAITPDLVVANDSTIEDLKAEVGRCLIQSASAA